jgi:peptide subunit release factor 1 (eRF1)
MSKKLDSNNNEIKKLDNSKGNGTSMVSLVIPAKETIQ